jgi:putative permease
MHMSETARSEEAEPAFRPPASAPMVISQGLTYRDLQRSIFLAFALLVVWHLAEPLTTLLLFFLLVFILAAVLNPVVVKLQRRGIPRIASAVTVAVLVLAGLGLLSETTHFVETLDQKQQMLEGYYVKFQGQYPELAEQLPPAGEIFQKVTPTLSRLAGMLGRYTMNIAVGIASLFMLLILVIYAVAQPAPMLAGLLTATPERYRDRMDVALRRILQQLKNWAFGSLVLGLIVGVVCGVGLHLLGVPSALLFGIIAGIGELIPNVGPILSAVPPILVALSIDPQKALWVALFFVGVQQVENSVLVPRIMGEMLNLHPLSVIFTVMVMGALFGLLGAVMAVPVCAIIKVCYEEFYVNPQGIRSDRLLAAAEDIVTNGVQPPSPAPEVEPAPVETTEPAE